MQQINLLILLFTKIKFQRARNKEQGPNSLTFFKMKKKRKREDDIGRKKMQKRQELGKRTSRT